MPPPCLSQPTGIKWPDPSINKETHGTKQKRHFLVWSGLHVFVGYFFYYVSYHHPAECDHSFSNGSGKIMVFWSWYGPKWCYYNQWSLALGSVVVFLSWRFVNFRNYEIWRYTYFFWTFIQYIWKLVFRNHFFYFLVYPHPLARSIVLPFLFVLSG